MLLTAYRKMRRNHTPKELAAVAVICTVALLLAGVVYALVPWTLLQDPNFHVTPDLWIYYGITLVAPACVLGLIWAMHTLD
jgi:protein-S-isoprenylcysteine O-methyltransferase Ste14